MCQKMMHNRLNIIYDVNLSMCRRAIIFRFFSSSYLLCGVPRRPCANNNYNNVHGCGV